MELKGELSIHANNDTTILITVCIAIIVVLVVIVIVLWYMLAKSKKAKRVILRWLFSQNLVLKIIQRVIVNQLPLSQNECYTSNSLVFVNKHFTSIVYIHNLEEYL